jgi:transcriptional regulator with XRE-family HTH domain
MPNLYEYIGDKIRELRQHHGGRGLSQEALAKGIHTTANTISRWETAAYKPSVKDLHSLARFFGVSMSVFFPDSDNARLQALMSATGDLNEEDIQDLAEYARFRKARRALELAGKKKKRSL